MATSNPRLTWRADRGIYDLYDPRSGEHLPFVRDDEQRWLTWLRNVSAFSFAGQCGSLTVRKEARPRGDRYWYAYRRLGPRMAKKYAGRTANLTLARLEELAAAFPPPDLHAAERPRLMTPDGQRTPQRAKRTDQQAASEAPAPHVVSGRSDVLRDRVLATKLHRPHPRTRLIARSHLIARLQQAMEHALTLLSAPAGFGKTTLLAQWLASSAVPAAWLSLDPDDNDPVRFLTYLLAALHTAVPQVSLSLQSLLEAEHPPQSTLLENALTVLTNHLMDCESPDFALVLDDYHVVTNPAIHRAFTFLVNHLPPHMHVVLASRADPPLALAALRARGHLVELRANDLRFNDTEVRSFLQMMTGVDLPSEALATLEHRTEGWVAGLQLAALSLRGRDDIPAFVAAFVGSHRFVLDYLSEEVLARQPAPIQHFLLHTSILERLCGSLCEAVTGQDGGHARLEALERANLFVVPLDDERQWYRYHHLFAEVLKHRLEQTEPDVLPELHRRASAWYERQGFIVEAVQHALAGRDVELAAHLVRQPDFFAALIAQGRPRLLLEWFSALPDSLVRADVLLCVYQASALHVVNRGEEAASRLRDMQAAQCAHSTCSASPPADVEETRFAAGVAATIRANLVRYRGNLEGYLALGQQAFDLLQEGAPMPMRAVATIQTAHRFLASGEVTAAAEQRVRDAVAFTAASGYELVAFRCLTLLARLYALQGRLRAAAAVYEQAGEATPAKVMQVLTAKATYCFGLGDLLREWNRLDEAEHLLSQGVDQVREATSSFADEVLFGHVALARLLQACGKYDRAVAILDAFEHLVAARRFVPEMRSAVATARARIALMQGHVETAARWAQASGVSADDSDLSYPREHAYLTLARVRTAQASENGAVPLLRDTLHLLDRLLANAETNARTGSVVEILVVQALALKAHHEHKRALATLDRALALAAPEGYIRLFVDEGAPMQVLLRDAQARGMMPAYITMLLAAFRESASSAFTAPPAALHATLVEPLTKREREVLQLLAEGASNREIARRLILSTGTVKKHVYNICGKLGVRSRTQALVRARALRLL